MMVPKERRHVTVSECYNLVGDEEWSPCAWSVDLMTRTWMTYKANLPAFREDESLNSLMAYIMCFETLRAYTQIASENERTEGSSWVAPTRVAGVLASVTVDATSNDPPELEVLLPTDGVTRFHVDAHGVRWEIPGSLFVAGHSSQRDQHTGWGQVSQVGCPIPGLSLASLNQLFRLPLSGMPGSKIWSDFTIEFRVVVGAFLDVLGSSTQHESILVYTFVLFVRKRNDGNEKRGDGTG
eukprot:scaffold4994_cov36-Attheya_sp.AAC.1